MAQDAPFLDRIIAEYGRALAQVAASNEAERKLQADLMQDILLAIHRALPNLRTGERIAPYVFKIAHNRFVSHVA